AEAEAGMERARFLVEAGNILHSSFEKEATLQGLAALLVPRFADSCAVHLVGDDERGALREIASVHADAATSADLEARLSPVRVLAARAPELEPEGLCVPIVAREKALGTLTFGRADRKRGFADADLSFAEELARKAALALENADLYRKAQ